MQGNSQVGWQMDTTCSGIINEDIVSCWSRNIRDLTGIQYFDNVQQLNCGGNLLTYIPPLPDNLLILECANNQIVYLPPLPLTLTNLSCSANPVDSLPALPSTLVSLNCISTQLRSLPILPDSLIQLDCSQNQLTSLPVLPASLTNLMCSYNQLTSLPVLPNKLFRLVCAFNQLTTLPILPRNLYDLFCHDNQLNSFPNFPDSMQFCRIYNNPIICLPQLKSAQYFDFFNTLVTCLPNYGNVGYSSPLLNSLPLCNEFNTNGCDVFWNISGNTYYDFNSDCINDTVDIAQRNIKIQLKSGGNLLQQTFTGAEGFFSFDIDSFFTYEVSADTANIPFYVSCPANNLWLDTIIAVDSFEYHNNFALECKPGFDLAAWSIAGRAFIPANITTIDIHVGGASRFYGVNCSGGISGSVVIQVTGPATYVAPSAGALTPDNVSGNTLTYNVADFGTVDFNNSFNIMVQIDTTAPIGSQICFTVTVSPITGDEIPSNNIQTHCFTVVNSWDPNDKQVYPAADIDTAQKWLTYTIRFQNTGTAEAQHIYITDTLDADLDVSSFQLLAYSHQPMVQLKENAVRFNFPNINLPDSNTNEPLSHGYVQYKIKLKDNLPIGTAINNTAFIYFDFNAPVVTNTTTNTIAVVSSANQPPNPLKGRLLRIYPNPATDLVTIRVDEEMIGSTATVTDVTGRKMMAVNLTTQYSLLNTSSFSKGVYFISVQHPTGNQTVKKLVVE